MRWKQVVEREDEDLELDGTRFFRGFLFGCLATACFFVMTALVAVYVTKN